GCCVKENCLRGICLIRYQSTLRQKIAQNKYINCDLVIINIVSAANHLHSIRYIHNDFNPNNIMIDNASQQTIVIDLDLCKLIGTPRTRKCGTEGYEKVSGIAKCENGRYSISQIIKFIRNHVYLETGKQDQKRESVIRWTIVTIAAIQHPPPIAAG
ncbi:hypothetical protein BJ085DRAFT_22526, partial [Dimargaris cristalligena]